MAFQNLNLALFFQKTAHIGLLLIASFFAQKAFSQLVLKTKKLQPPQIAKSPRVKTLRSLIINSSRIVINFVVFAMILSELGINIAPLLAGAGILGLAVGFGAKDLVTDLIAGFFIILENQVNIGDTVQIGPSQGKIRKLSLRTLTLKDKSGKIHLIPNSTIKTIIKFPPAPLKKLTKPNDSQT